MTEKTEFEAEASAEKAYAAAAESVTPKPAPVVAAAKADPKVEVEFPSKAKRVAKTVAAKPASKPATPPVVPKTKPSATKIKPVPAPKIVASKAATPNSVAKKPVFQQLKDKTVSTTDFTSKIKTAVGDAQTKAKEAFDKGAATFAEYNEFSKGNVEAVVASGKILAAGAQSLGKTFVDDGKNAFETLTAEVKELAAVKSPADFFKLQVEFLRRNFDIAVSNTSKNSEAVLKLASEAAAPISARVNLAVEKVKQAA